MNKKTVFQYHPETKVYLGETFAMPCPVSNPEGDEKKDWIAPGYTTELPPLEHKDGYVVVWKEAQCKWDYMELPKPEVNEEETKEEETPEEAARKKRNKLLRESDFTQLVDVYASMTEEEKQAWINYRQKLRDIPSQKNFPNKINWPKAPTK
jgi:hypothetical protein